MTGCLPPVRDQKSESTWSRSNVTLVIDNSIYKQFLSWGEAYPEFDKFFSGQFNGVVYGFRLTLLGIVIDGIFYPTSFYISSKKYTEEEVVPTLRDYIEQFFRFSKHTLKIQETKSTNPEEFCRKVTVNFLKVVICQAFTQFCQKNFKPLKKYSFLQN